MLKFFMIPLTTLVLAACFGQMMDAQDKSQSRAKQRGGNYLDKMRRIEVAINKSSIGRYDEAYVILRKLRSDYPNDLSITKQFYQMITLELKKKRNSVDTELLHQRYFELAELAREFVKGENNKPEIRKNMSQAIINEAVVYGIRKETDKCLSSLETAASWGFDDIRQLYLLSAFDDIRDMPKFKEIMGEAVTEYENEIFDYARNAIEKSRPYEFSVKGTTTDGKAFDFSKQRGKLLIVDLSGDFQKRSDRLSAKNIPGYNKLAKKYAEQNVQFVGIRFQRDKENGNQLTSEFGEKYSVEYPLLSATRELTPKIKGLNVLPSLMIIDTKGQVRVTLGGKVPMITLEAFLKLHLNNELEGLVFKEPVADDAEEKKAEKGDGSSGK